MSSTKQQVNDLLKHVLIMETQQAFDFLAASEANDEVINEVALLLKPSETRTAFMEGRGLIENLFNESAITNLSGSQIQNIKIIEPLGHGGMGAVYLAEDTTLQRKVAVKALHTANQLNPAVQERFRREALILSQLDHPNICRIYNLIEAETVDYLVLELVDGKTLKESGLNELSQSRKFKVALSLLDALKAAHNKNIIHRDLKPENIMFNEKGQIKVLDFGISRLSNANKLSTDNLSAIAANKNHTLPGAVLGTLAYMSPEQAGGRELTTASDIYTLGLVFQELFSGIPVYADGLTAEQILKYSTAAETQVPTDLSNDLTQLIQRMKSKSAAERPTAVDAIMLMKNIQAKPARRLRYGIVSVLILLVSLGIYKYINDLNFEREQANVARTQSEHVTAFLTSIFKESNPYYLNAEDISAIDLLDQGAQRIDEELKYQPEIQVMLKATIGDVYHVLGLLEKSKALITPAYEQSLLLPQLSNKSKGTIAYMYATLQADLDNYDFSEKLFLEAKKTLNDPESQQTLEINNFLAMLDNRLNKLDSTIEITKEIINVYKDHPEYDIEVLLTALNTAGMAYQVKGNLEEAENHYQTALDRVNQIENVNLGLHVNIIGNLAGLYSATERKEKSLEYRKKVVEISEARLPENHPDLIDNYDNLAVDYFYLKDLEQAKFWNKKSLDVFEAIKKENPNQSDNFIYQYYMVLANYGVLLTQSDGYLEAKDVFIQVVENLEKILGAKHHTVADYLMELGQVYFKLKEYVLADQVAERAIAIYDKDGLPYSLRKQKVKLLKASLLNLEKQYTEVELIEIEVFNQLEAMDPQNNDLIEMAKEKFNSLKADRNSI